MKSYKKKSDYADAKELITEKLTDFTKLFGEIVTITFDGSHVRADGEKVPNAYCLAVIRCHEATECTIKMCGNVIPAGCLAEFRAWVPGEPERDALLGRLYCSLDCIRHWSGASQNEKHRCAKDALCYVWHLTQGVT